MSALRRESARMAAQENRKRRRHCHSSSDISTSEAEIHKHLEKRSRLRPGAGSSPQIAISVDGIYNASNLPEKTELHQSVQSSNGRKVPEISSQDGKVKRKNTLVLQCEAFQVLQELDPKLAIKVQDCLLRCDETEDGCYQGNSKDGISVQDIARVISDRGWWNFEVLEKFSSSTVEKLVLSKSTGLTSPHSDLLRSFFKLDSFRQLTWLSLSNLTLSLEDLALLRVLPNLNRLGLASTGLTSTHLLHMISHAPTLQVLDVSHNDRIDDEAKFPLTVLPQLRELFLRGTSLSLPCLRLLVYSLPPECRLLTVPQPCLDHLKARIKRYYVQVPEGYVEDPRHVPNLTLNDLKRNLQLHRIANKDIVTTGSKAEMVSRLTNILCARVADGRLERKIGSLT